MGRSESAAAHRWSSLQAPPGTRGLRIRPRRHGGAVATVLYIVRRRHPPAFGRAAPRPAPFARPRPPKACSPLRSSASLCLTVRSAAERKPPPPLRLPAAPAGSGSPSPASAATAQRTAIGTLSTFPSRLAGLAVLQRLAVQDRPNPPSRPERPTANCYLPARTRPLGTPGVGKLQEKYLPREAAAAPPPLWVLIIG